MSAETLAFIALGLALFSAFALGMYLRSQPPLPREKATVTFVVEHGHEDQAVLLDAALVDGVITGRWQPDLRGDEGWYSFPLYRIKQIQWEPMDDGG